MPSMTLTSNRSQVTLMRILDCLSDGPLTIKEVSRDALIAHRWVMVYINELRRLKAVHIWKWTRNKSGPPYFHIVLGEGVDAKRPSAQPSAKKTEAYRKRMKESGEWEFRRSRRSSQEHADRVAKVPQVWFGALVGVRGMG